MRQQAGIATTRHPAANEHHGSDNDDDDTVPPKQPQQQQQQRTPQYEMEAEEDEDEDLWGEDAPSSVEGQEDRPVAWSLPTESRRVMEDWADKDDDEDNWKDALQARVDQLELVVEGKRDALPLESAQEHRDEPAPVFAHPVDQRATLTLLPRAKYGRSASAPEGPTRLTTAASRTTAVDAKTTTTTTTTTTVAMTATSNNLPQKSKELRPQPHGPPPSQGPQARKRSNSRDYLTRSTNASDAKKVSKLTTASKMDVNSRSGGAPPSAMVGGVFVRAVVARGPTDPMAGGGRVGRIDGKSRKSEEHTGGLSEAEAIRRFVLGDVKKISVERIVADARRLQFLEEQYRRHQMAPASVPAADAVDGRASPTKRRQ